jgi:hypothetical protein
MTRAERLRKELELLKLQEAEERDANRALPSPAPTPAPTGHSEVADGPALEAGSSDGPSRAESFWRGAGQGITVGFGDEVNGFIQALGEKYLPESLGGGGEQAQTRTLGDLYRANRDSFRREDAAAERAHGGYYLGGNLLGGVATAPLLPGAGSGRTLGQLMWHGAKVGGISGGAYGLGASNAELTPDKMTLGDALQVSKDMGSGVLLGGTLGAAAPPIAAGAGWLARNVGAPAMKFLRGGYINPTPEAQRLTAQGARLTLGQMAPNSSMGRMEELASSKFTAGGVANLRNEGVSTTRDALFQKAAAPGAAPPTKEAPAMQQLDEIGSGFTKAYDEVLDDVRIWPERYLAPGKWRGLVTGTHGASPELKGAFNLAANARDIDASPAARKRALLWLENEAAALAPLKSGLNEGTVEARSVQALRTKLRDKVRQIGENPQGEDRALKEIYERARDAVSELLDGQLPPENAAKLRALDSSYRNKLAVERAAHGAKAFREGQGGEFTATQLLEAIRQGGATPELESLTRDAHQVLSAKYSPTGLQGHALNAVPWAEYGAAPASYLVNTVPFLRDHALKQVFAPGLPARALGATGRALESAGKSTRATSTTSRTLYDLLTQSDAPEDAVMPWAATP